jgi:ComF family protein
VAADLAKGLRLLTAALRRALFPDKCLLCGAFFTPWGAEGPHDGDAFQRCLGEWLCDGCRGDRAPLGAPRCPRCGLPFTTDQGPDHLCGDCRTRPGAFERARAAGRYEGALKSLILNFKFQGQVGLAAPLGRLLLDTFEHHWSVDAVDLILPVPLHPRRMRRRGYNQSYLLLRGWMRWYAEAHHSPLPCLIERDLLRRVRPTPAQTGLNRSERERNLSNAFALARPLLPPGPTVLLVDDVLTTGATVNACARVLKAGGAARVEVLTLARTV